MWITPVLRPQPLFLLARPPEIPYRVRMNMHRNSSARATKAQQRLDAMLRQAYAHRRLAVPEQPKDAVHANVVYIPA